LTRKFLRFAENDLGRSPGICLTAASGQAANVETGRMSRMAKGRTNGRKVGCEDCFFRQNLLCALPDDEPCATFRPAHPDGLRPPRQMRFQFRQERRTQAVWAFPSAQEQAALHA
jgi:hypothetical protein